MRSKFALAIAAIVLLCGFNQDGQYDEVPEHLRKWFKGVRSPHGVPCCDIADGHPTDEDIRKDAYYVPDPLNEHGPWLRIPDEAVVHNAGNPVGRAVVWWVRQSGNTVYIRCFVPGGGA